MSERDFSVGDSASVPVPAKGRVCHIITSLNAGGAERMLTRLVCADPDAARHHVVISLMDEGVFGADIRAKGVTLHTLGMRSGRPSLGKMWELARLLRAIQPDVLMTWLYHADLLGIVFGRLAGIKRIYWNLRCSNMNLGRLSRTSKAVMWALVRLSPYPSGVIVNSHAGRDHHSQQGYRPRAWHIISNGVDMGQFHRRGTGASALRAELGLAADVQLVGHVARYHPMKDHAAMIRAAAKVCQARPDAHFVLVGSGVNDTNQTLARQIEDCGLNARVSLLGRRDDIADLLPQFDVMALSSAYGEGAPNVIIEAMACGVPCAVTDVGDSARIVDDVGRVAPPGDSDALADGILDLLNLPPSEREALQARVRARVEEHYAIGGVMAQYDELLWGGNARG